jgi:hypothetical protein
MGGSVHTSQRQRHNDRHREEAVNGRVLAEYVNGVRLDGGSEREQYQRERECNTCTKEVDADLYEGQLPV